jgi:hypothetical protein
MLHKINCPTTIPWSKLVDWKAFGDDYNSIKLTRKHLSNEILDWLDAAGVKPISCNMLTVFPDKSPPMFINSEWCQADNHAKLYWVYDVPIEYTWYKFTTPLGIDNQEALIANPGEYEECKFNDPPTGWVVRQDALEIAGTEVIMPGQVTLLNIGTAHTIKVTSAARAKVFCIGIESKENYVSRVNGMPFNAALQSLCTQST